jgi:N-acetylglucosaminyldiphosphoundecaprenol N-acetyl-beta-D-mannosaminyltransferase
MGYHRSMKWIAENRKYLGDLIVVNVGGAFDTLAGTRKKAPAFIAAAGYTWLWRTLNKPYRWHRFLLVCYWFLEVTYFRLFRKKR